eukprot:455561_1
MAQIGNQSLINMFNIIHDFAAKWNEYETQRYNGLHNLINPLELHKWSVETKSGSIYARMTNYEEELSVKRYIVDVHKINACFTENNIDAAYFKKNHKKDFRKVLKKNCSISACIANTLWNYIKNSIRTYENSINLMDYQLDKLCKEILQ